MSSVVRRSAAPFLAAAIMGGMLTAGVVAQGLPPSERAGPLAPDDPARCESWGEQQAPVVVRPGFATVGGLGVSSAAVEVEQADPSCTLSQVTMEGVPAVVRDLFEDLLARPLVGRSDADGDMLTLTGDPLSGEPDPALDINFVSYGVLDISRRQAQALARAFESDELADEVNVTFARRPRDWIERGTYQITILDLAGDPTTPTETQRIWQLGLEARDPAKSVSPMIPVGSPIAGVRNLVTYAQVVREDGSIQRTVGRSDFGSNKVGPDGQSQYYNARADVAVLEWQDAVAILNPAPYGPLGARPMTFHRASGGWDIVNAPGGPLAFLPASGAAPGMFDFVALALEHESITLPATVDGVASDSPLPWPSQNGLLFGTPIFDPTQPVDVDLSYLVGGREVTFSDLEAQPLGDGLFWTPYGIPTYGDYQLTGLDLQQAGFPVPETWDQLAEMGRALGARRWMVGEEAGLLHGWDFHDTWLTGPGAQANLPYDGEVVARTLEELGFVPDP